MRIFRRIAKSRFVHACLSDFQWFRKWHGGRWELWWIGPCFDDLWLDIQSWRSDHYRPPCAEGRRIDREDWPTKDCTGCQYEIEHEGNKVCRTMTRTHGQQCDAYRERKE